MQTIRDSQGDSRLELHAVRQRASSRQFLEPCRRFADSRLSGPTRRHQAHHQVSVVPAKGFGIAGASAESMLKPFPATLAE